MSYLVFIVCCRRHREICSTSKIIVGQHYYRILKPSVPSEECVKENDYQVSNNRWLCMVINISVQYNGGLPPGIMLLTQGYYHWGTHLNTM